MLETDSSREGHSTSVASRVLDNGRTVEAVYLKGENRTAFAVYEAGAVTYEKSIEVGNGERLIPVSPSNNLIRHGALLFPERAELYGTPIELVASIGEYLYRYLDLSDEFRRIASYYVLLSWVYDAFNELPYLRLRGDFGSGKTRGLTVIGSVCYRPFFASGASTVSPIFHTLDSFGGTLILDEADFRFTDEKSELVKLLNNGTVRGFPVLRTAITQKREFEPRAFQVFGPKIVAMRHSFEDHGLESRFLTEDMGQRKLRGDIPISLPDAQREEAQQLRNKLLMYRFENLENVKIDPDLVDETLSPRQNQILAPLLALIDDEELREEIRQTTKGLEQSLYSERASSSEAAVLEIVLEKLEVAHGESVSISDIAGVYRERYGNGSERPLSNRDIGTVLRRRLRIATYKSHGIYVVPASEHEKIRQIASRYGIEL